MEYNSGKASKGKITIYTVGYGGRKLQDFKILLKKYCIKIVADVRQFPRSSSPEYNREALAAYLKRHGIKYAFMGDTLGGLRREGYEKYTETETYKEGIRNLLELAKEGDTVILCKERSDKGCHRRYIVKTLTDLNVNVIPVGSRIQSSLLCLNESNNLLS